MDLRVESQDRGAALVTMTGRFDLLSASEAKQRLSQAVSDGHRNLVVDLGGISFIDSSGLGALIGALKAARLAGGDLRIARPNAQAKSVLELTTLNRVLRPYETVEEALAGYA